MPAEVGAYGVNPEVAHEHMAGVNFMHGMAQAWEAGESFQIDLSLQHPGRHGRGLRFGSRGLKTAFFLVKRLEYVGNRGCAHFDAHACRTEDYAGVRHSARGRRRTCSIPKEKAAQFDADKVAQAPLGEIKADDSSMPVCSGRHSPRKALGLEAQPFDRSAAAAGLGLQHERLSQMTIDLLLGTR
jgi:xylose isomerase